MPTYEYKCSTCDHRFEVQQSMTEDALTKCPEPECNGSVSRVIGQNVGIAFKGSGFYINDSQSASSDK